MGLNVAKTEFMVIGSNQRLFSFSDDQINIEIDAKFLIIEERLSLSNHVRELSKNMSSDRRPVAQLVEHRTRVRKVVVRVSSLLGFRVMNHVVIVSQHFNVYNLCGT